MPDYPSLFSDAKWHFSRGDVLCLPEGRSVCIEMPIIESLKPQKFVLLERLTGEFVDCPHFERKTFLDGSVYSEVTLPDGFWFRFYFKDSLLPKPIDPTPHPDLVDDVSLDPTQADLDASVLASLKRMGVELMFNNDAADRLYNKATFGLIMDDFEDFEDEDDLPAFADDDDFDDFAGNQVPAEAEDVGGEVDPPAEPPTSTDDGAQILDN